MPIQFMKARDPLSCYTHFIGLLLSCAGILIMIAKASANQFHTAQMTGLLFCFSLIGLYGASSLYHYSNADASTIGRLRKLDHSMIYMLIAGSYTPLLYAILPAPKSSVFLLIIWTLAMAGIVMKLCWIHAPRWFGVILYLSMGWFIAVDLPALKALPSGALLLLISGGLLYTAGGIIYAIKKPNIGKMFGFHEIFHLFVLGGSLCHYCMVLFYLV